MRPKTLIFLNASSIDNNQSLMLEGVEDVARRRGAKIVRYNINSSYNLSNNPTSPFFLLKELIETQCVDGILYLGWLFLGKEKSKNKYIDYFQTLSIPVVNVGVQQKLFPNVYFDGENAMHQILDHLYETHASRRIAMLPPINPDDRDDRFFEFCKERKIWDSQLYLESLRTIPENGDFELRAEYATREILKIHRRQPIDAVVSMYSVEAKEVIHLLQKEGVKVPSEIKVISWEASELWKLYEIALSAFDFPYREIGADACEKALDLIEGRSPSFSTPVRSQFHARQSCGCSELSEDLDWLLFPDRGPEFDVDRRDDERSRSIAQFVASTDRDDLRRVFDALFPFPESNDLDVYYGQYNAIKSAFVPFVRSRVSATTESINYLLQALIRLKDKINRLLEFEKTEIRIQKWRESWYILKLSSSLDLSHILGNLKEISKELGVQYEFFLRELDPRAQRDTIYQTNLSLSGELLLQKVEPPYGIDEIVTRNAQTVVFDLEPLSYDDNLFGFLVFVPTRMNERVLNDISRQLASSLHAAAIHKDLTDKNQRIETGLKISKVVSSVLGYDKLLEAFFQVCYDRLNVKHVSIYLRRGNTTASVLERLQSSDRNVQWIYDDDPDVLAPIRDAIERREIVVSDFKNEKRISVPLYESQNVLGVLHFVTRAEAATIEVLSTFRSVGEQLSIALLNVSLFAQVENARLRSESDSKSKTDFIASMSHELRTPLNSIIGFSNLVLREKELSNESVEKVRTVLKSAEHLLFLINEILDIARIESGKMDLHPEPVELDEVMRSVMSLITVKLHQKKLSEHVWIDPNLPAAIWTDKKKLKQIVVNLLSNAVKFTETGSVSLKVTRTAGPDADSNWVVRFEVVDTGIGIEAHELSKLFVPFEQTGAAEQRAQGFGLGLAISQKLAQLMGSKLLVESEWKKGSRFWFDLETREVDVPAFEKTVEEIVDYEGPRQVVLVVDDSDDNRSLLRIKLRACGFVTYEAHNGKDALEKVYEHRPNLILTDIKMPVMDGIEMTREIRKDRAFDTTVVIATTASVFLSDKETCLNAGCQDFLEKPIVDEELFNSISKHAGIKWIRTSQHEHATEAGRTVVEKLPNAQTIEEIRALAQAGKIHKIAELLQRVSGDAELQPFCSALTPFVKAFNEKGLLNALARMEDHVKNER